MPGPERRLIGEHLQRRLTSCFEQPTETVLPRPLESTQGASGGRRSAVLTESLHRPERCTDGKQRIHRATSARRLSSSDLIYFRVPLSFASDAAPVTLSLA